MDFINIGGKDFSTQLLDDALRPEGDINVRTNQSDVTALAPEGQGPPLRSEDD